jgi:uncharacterized protein
MKKVIACILLLFSVASFAQRKYPPIKKSKIDTALIRKLDADKYGMSKYVMCFLKSGPNGSLSADSAKKIQAAHLKNIERLADEGKIVLAGPFLDNTELEGIFIFNVKTLEEARELTNTDPAVKAGILIMELHPWYGSATLKEIPERHKMIQAKGF